MTRRIVLVGGPEQAGVSGVAAALRERLGESVVEAAGLPPGAVPTVVVFVVSAAARLVASDCVVLDALCGDCDTVIGVVSKIDAHRAWRDTVAANRIALAGYRDRHAAVDWVGVAATPDLGEPQTDELAALLGRILAEPPADRKGLRTNGIRVVPRTAGAATSVLLRSRTQQVRVGLAVLARSRCAQLRAELVDGAGALTRHNRAGFAAHVQSRIAEVAAELEDEVTDRLAIVAAELDLPDEPPGVQVDPPAPAGPPVDPRGLESRLMTMLGAGFGLGVALTLGRVAVELAPAHSVSAALIAVLLGVASAGWLVATRKLIAERAAMQRWVGDSVAAMRAAADEAVALRLIAAERLWSTTVLGRGGALSESVYLRT